MEDSFQRKGRKRKILVETVGNPSPKLVKPDKLFSDAYWQVTDLYRQNRFVVELEDNSGEKVNIIPTSRIKSFKINGSPNGNNNTIVIESILTLDEWIDDFLKVDVCRVFLLNSSGKVVKYFDYDIANTGYEYELAYSKDEFLSPKFFYRILQ